ncbi:MAG: transposase [Ignavibacteriales bacterium]|nr:transposase [Ignavibacteriales bacterium]
MNQSGCYHYHRTLPHFIVNGGIYFVTFRLAGTIPPAVLEQMEQDIGAAKLKGRHQISTAAAHHRMKRQKRASFQLMEEYLDCCRHGEKLLERDDLAEIVAAGMRKRDGTMYTLIASTIMPNHVHMVIRLNRDESPTDLSNQKWHHRLANVIGALKKRTSSVINNRLGRSGQLWQYETYDHLVRNAEELERIVSYVLNNPVKAGLSKDELEWKWNYRRAGQL